MPDLFDLGERHFRPFGEPGLGEPRRDADAERSGQELEQRPALGGIEPVQPIGQEARHLARHGALQLLHDVVKPRRLHRRLGSWPDQRDGLGGIADVIAREAEQHRIDTGFDHLGKDAAERQPEEQPVSERCERPAAVRVWRRGKIIGEQAQFVVARRRIGEPVQEFRELLHDSSSSRPISANALPVRPVDWMWCRSASSRPCVTHTSRAPVS